MKNKKLKIILSLGIASFVPLAFVSSNIYNQNSTSKNNSIQSLKSNNLTPLSTSLENEIYSSITNTFQEFLNSSLNSNQLNMIAFRRIIDKFKEENYSRFSTSFNEMEQLVSMELFSKVLNINNEEHLNTLTDEEKKLLIETLKSDLSNQLKIYLNNEHNYPVNGSEIAGSNTILESEVSKIENSLKTFFREKFNVAFEQLKISINSKILQHKNLDMLEVKKEIESNLDSKITFPENINGLFLNNSNIIFNLTNKNITIEIIDVIINTRDIEIGNSNKDKIGSSIRLNLKFKLNNAIEEKSLVIDFEKRDIFRSIEEFANIQFRSAIENLKSENINQKNVKQNLDDYRISDFEILKENEYVDYRLAKIEISPENSEKFILTFNLFFKNSTLKNKFNLNNREITFPNSIRFQSSPEEIKIILNRKIDLNNDNENELNLVNSLVNILYKGSNQETTPLSSLQQISNLNLVFGPDQFLNPNYSLKVNRISEIDNDYGSILIDYTIFNKKEPNIFKSFSRTLTGFKGLMPITNAIKDFTKSINSKLNGNSLNTSSSLKEISNSFFNQNHLSKLVFQTRNELRINSNFQASLSEFKKNSIRNQFDNIYNIVLDKMSELFSNPSFSTLTKEDVLQIENAINSKTNDLINELKNRLNEKGLDSTIFEKNINETVKKLNDLISEGISLETILNSKELINLVKQFENFENLSDQKLNELISATPDILRIITETQKNILYGISAATGASIILLGGIVYQVNRKKGIKLKSVKGITITSLSIMTISSAILISLILQLTGLI
ncbi:hypothetical protein [[Mycoplasma] mobile]|uniref:Expressed protein n=1 Tax=Mycoplasma mobile (strain ATCC 43663 / 163K / NCTC 11711) TaxID=267748 RepID=Q6KHZ2_MYCM1|nr:hypothetical protein [[Mycoplasma] mobile]AAT27784.1 expressed protein [Mycoplasma mobile 163K]